MNDDLKEIQCLLMLMVKLDKKRYYIKHNHEYICKHYNSYEKEYIKICTHLEDTKELFIKKCNYYIDYPKQKFLFIDKTKKIQFRYEEWIGSVLIIPFVDKREYYCLINLFEHMEDYISKQCNIGKETHWLIG